MNVVVRAGGQLLHPLRQLLEGQACRLWCVSTSELQLHLLGCQCLCVRLRHARGGACSAMLRLAMLQV